jgi:lysophospholipase L1-like esterase
VDSNKRLWIYAGLVLAAGVGLATAAPSTPSPAPLPLRPPLGAGSRLLLVGDSLAHGLAVPLGAISRAAQAALLVDARSGTRMDQWASEPWLGRVLLTNPQLVLVSLGTNDMKAMGSAPQKHMARILAIIQGSGAEVAWIMPPTMPFPDPVGIGAMLLTLPAAGVPLFRSDKVIIPRAADGIHPTAAGYAGWAAHIWKWLQPGRARFAASAS